MVSVLDALESDKRVDVIAELIKQQKAEMASRLLLELRNRGWIAANDAENLYATNPAASGNPAKTGLAGRTSALGGGS